MARRFKRNRAMTRRITILTVLIFLCAGMSYVYGYTYTYNNKTGYPVRVIVQLYDEADRSGEIGVNESFAFSTKALLKSWTAEAFVENKWQRVLDMTCDLLPGNHTYFIYVDEARKADGAVDRNWNAIIE
jgi:hypothetical protein